MVVIGGFDVMHCYSQWVSERWEIMVAIFLEVYCGRR